MKKMMTMAILMVITLTANAMSYTAAKNEALFLSDKMAYELNLTAAQYEDVYEINIDYLMSVNGRNDILGRWWDRRNADLMHVLTAYQYNKYVGLPYFYRPLSWNKGGCIFNIYSHYTNRSHFYKARPTVYVTYKGGNNHKHVTHYVDRKPTHNNGSTWRNTDRNNHGTANTGRDHGTPNRHIAQNANSNRSNGSGHFGGRR